MRSHANEKEEVLCLIEGFRWLKGCGWAGDDRIGAQRGQSCSNRTAATENSSCSYEIGEIVSACARVCAFSFAVAHEAAACEGT